MDKLVITYSRKRRRFKRKQEQPSGDCKKQKRVCQFCLSGEDNEVDYGTIYERDDVTVHYFCMLLSSGLCQNTRISDKNGILGFLLTDIKKELGRGNRLRCCFCHGKGATIGCCVKSCRRAFHLSCGRQNGTMHQFFDNFRSYCTEHRLVQMAAIEASNLKLPGKRTCAICMSAATSHASCDTLISPCCQRSWFHRACMQQYALSAGMHYFKCPLCNSVKDFQADMLKHGIYIPDRDASWEREPNAFHELLERHSTCDVSECTCPQGKEYSANSGKYELLLCGWCGSFGSHRACEGLVWRDTILVCSDCAEIYDTSEMQKQKEAAAGGNQQAGPVRLDQHLHTSPTRGQHARGRGRQRSAPQQPTGRRRGRPRGSRSQSQVLPRSFSSPDRAHLSQCPAEDPLLTKIPQGISVTFIEKSDESIAVDVTSVDSCDPQGISRIQARRSCNYKDKISFPSFACVVMLRRIDSEITLKSGRINVKQLPAFLKARTFHESELRRKRKKQAKTTESKSKKYDDWMKTKLSSLLDLKYMTNAMRMKKARLSNKIDAMGVNRVISDTSDSPCDSPPTLNFMGDNSDVSDNSENPPAIKPGSHWDDVKSPVGVVTVLDNVKGERDCKLKGETVLKPEESGVPEIKESKMSSLTVAENKNKISTLPFRPVIDPSSGYPSSSLRAPAMAKVCDFLRLDENSVFIQQVGGIIHQCTMLDKSPEEDKKSEVENEGQEKEVVNSEASIIPTDTQTIDMLPRYSVKAVTETGSLPSPPPSYSEVVFDVVKAMMEEIVKCIEESEHTRKLQPTIYAESQKDQSNDRSEVMTADGADTGNNLIISSSDHKSRMSDTVTQNDPAGKTALQDATNKCGKRHPKSKDSPGFEKFMQTKIHDFFVTN